MSLTAAIGRLTVVGSDDRLAIQAIAGLCRHIEDIRSLGASTAGFRQAGAQCKNLPITTLSKHKLVDSMRYSAKVVGISCGAPSGQTRVDQLLRPITRLTLLTSNFLFWRINHEVCPVFHTLVTVDHRPIVRMCGHEKITNLSGL